MTSTEIAEKLSCIPEKDIELLTGMMLAAKSGDDRRLLIDMLDRVNEYAYLTENGIPLGGIAYRDFVMGNCPIDAPSPETVEQFRKTLDAAETGDAEAQYTAAMMAMEGAVGLPDFDAAVKWLQKAADAGHPGALYELGICRLNGEGMQGIALDIDDINHDLARRQGRPRRCKEGARLVQARCRRGQRLRLDACRHLRLQRRRHADRPHLRAGMREDGGAHGLE